MPSSMRRRYGFPFDEVAIACILKSFRAKPDLDPYELARRLNFAAADFDYLQQRRRSGGSFVPSTLSRKLLQLSEQAHRLSNGLASIAMDIEGVPKTNTPTAAETSSGAERMMPYEVLSDAGHIVHEILFVASRLNDTGVFPPFGLFLTNEPDGVAELQQHNPIYGWPVGLQVLRSIEALKWLHKVLAAAAEHTSELTTKGGSRPDAARHVLMRRLVTIYEWGAADPKAPYRGATRSKSATNEQGEQLEFLDACFTVLHNAKYPQSFLSRPALYELRLRALKRRTRRNRKYGSLRPSQRRAT